MTKRVTEKAIDSYHNSYQSNISKSTERNNAEPCHPLDHHTFIMILITFRPKYLL